PRAGCGALEHAVPIGTTSQAPLRGRLRELAAVRVQYGYRRRQGLLARGGWHVNHKRGYRLKPRLARLGPSRRDLPQGLPLRDDARLLGFSTMPGLRSSDASL